MAQMMYQDASGAWVPQGPPTAGTATVASVSSSATSVAVKAANVNRRSLTVYNDSSAILYLALASSASTSVYTVQVPSQGTWVMPAPAFTGAISGIWLSANGAAKVTEVS